MNNLPETLAKLENFVLKKQSFLRSYIVESQHQSVCEVWPLSLSPYKGLPQAR